MANEISVVVQLKLANGNLAFDRSPGLLRFTQTTARLVSNVQVVGTTYEALVMGDVTTAGYAFFRNMDATNYVEVGLDVAAAFQPLVRLNAGETAVFRLTTNAPFARFNTLAGNLEYTILQT
jgi:hypothetical protein